MDKLFIRFVLAINLMAINIAVTLFSLMRFGHNTFAALGIVFASLNIVMLLILLATSGEIKK